MFLKVFFQIQVILFEDIQIVQLGTHKFARGLPFPLITTTDLFIKVEAQEK